MRVVLAFALLLITVSAVSLPSHDYFLSGTSASHIETPCGMVHLYDAGGNGALFYVLSGRAAVPMYAPLGRTVRFGTCSLRLDELRITDAAGRRIELSGRWSSGGEWQSFALGKFPYTCRFTLRNLGRDTTIELVDTAAESARFIVIDRAPRVVSLSLGDRFFAGSRSFTLIDARFYEDAPDNYWAGLRVTPSIYDL